MKTLTILVLALFIIAVSSCKKEEKKSPVDSPILVDDPIVNIIKPLAGSFLVLSDTHLRSEYTQKQVRNDKYSKNDVGHDLWKTTRVHFDSLMSGELGSTRPNFVLLLGDLPWHAYSRNKSDLKSARENTGKVLKSIRELATNYDIPVIYAPGNNDSWNGDYHRFHSPDDSIPFQLDRGFKKDWPLIGSSACGKREGAACIADATYRNLGFFSAYPLGKKAKFRVISLNSVMFEINSGSSHHYTNDNNYLSTQKADIQTQMDWLTKQMKKVDSLGEKTLLMMHIPPGIDGYGGGELWTACLTHYSEKEGKEIPVQNYFLELMDTYHKNIVGVLSSHTHLDGVRKLLNKSGDFKELLVSIPGIPTRNGNHPGIKSFTYNNTYELTNFTTTYNSYNSKYNHNVNGWKKKNTYNFKDIFKSSDTISMYNFIKDSITQEQLLDGVRTFYKVYNGKGDSVKVSRTLKVSYQQSQTSSCNNN